MKIKFYHLITFLFLLMTAGTGAAGTITVDNRGADYASIQEAVDNAAAGDTILVYPGTYEENVNVNKGVTIRSYSGNPEYTVVRAASPKKDVFRVTANNVTIDGFRMTGAVTDDYGQDKAGVYFEGRSGVVLLNNTIISNNLGIFLIDSHNNTLINNSVISNRLYGIWLWGSCNNVLENNNVKSNRNNIFLWEGCCNNRLNNNYVSNSGEGIAVQRFCNNTTLTGNIAINNSIDGFILTWSDNCSLVNNTANSNNHHGIYFAIGKNNLLKNNTANFNQGDGILMYRSLNSELVNNNASGNTGYGIHMGKYSINNILRCNTANSNGNGAIHIVEQENNTVIDACFEENASSNESAPEKLSNSNENDSVSGDASGRSIPGFGLLGSLICLYGGWKLRKK